MAENEQSDSNQQDTSKFTVADGLLLKDQATGKLVPVYIYEGQLVTGSPQD